MNLDLFLSGIVTSCVLTMNQKTQATPPGLAILLSRLLGIRS